MSVRITPGRISFTVMPCGARRRAKRLVIIETPAFETQYSPRLVEAYSELIEAMLTIARRPPRPWRGGVAIINRATRWVRKKGPRRLVPSRRSQLSGVV